MHEILERTAFLTFMYFICFVWHLLLNTPREERNWSGVNIYAVIDWINPNLLPIIVWLILILYLFIPSPCISLFNFRGRKYFLLLLWDCIRTPFVRIEFKISWMTDMIVSFAGPLKDFHTTICLYIS